MGQAVILAGGFGTRLSHIVSDKPKPLAPIGGEQKPFLEFVIKTLKKQGFDNFVFLTGYKAEQIEEQFKQLKNISFFEIGYRNYYDRDSKGDFYYCTPDFLKSSTKKRTI